MADNRSIRWPVGLLVTGLALAACGSGPDPVATAAGTGSTPSPTAGRSPAPDTNGWWAEPEDLGGGVVLPALGPLDPGVLIGVEPIETPRDGTAPSVPPPSAAGLSLAVSRCALVAPGRWLVSGEATATGPTPASTIVWFEREFSDTPFSDRYELTFAGTGPFTLAVDLRASPNTTEDMPSILAQDGGTFGCGLRAGPAEATRADAERGDGIPRWQAPAGSVQGYPLGGGPVSWNEGLSLRRDLAYDVWLGRGYPFDELWLPADDAGFGLMSTTNRVFCPLVQYRAQVGDAVAAEITHHDGDCVALGAAGAAVDGAPDWQWLEPSPFLAGPVAERTIDDGRLRVSAPDEATITEIIAQLEPHPNALVAERPSGPGTPEEAATAELAKIAPDAGQLSLHSTFPVDGGQVLAYSGPASCSDCTPLVWYPVLVRQRPTGWQAQGLGGGGWDGCLGLLGGSGNGVAYRGAIAGRTDWTLERQVGGAWEPVPAVDGFWIELIDPSALQLLPMRALGPDGTVQPCELTGQA